MPHLTIEYTANLEAIADIPGLCKKLGETLVALPGEDGPLFPITGTRVMARPAPHFSVADGHPARAFIFILARITGGRSDAMKQRAGEALLADAKAHLAPVFAQHALGLTLQIEEGQPVYEGKHNNLGGYLAPR
ncbi:MAG: 5-carboxymethyl-2-hydroxymuconate isomerase [Pseudomonadota bacterium]